MADARFIENGNKTSGVFDRQTGRGEVGCYSFYSVLKGDSKDFEHGGKNPELMEFLDDFQDAYEPYEPKGAEHMPFEYGRFHNIVFWFGKKGQFGEKPWYFF